MPLTVWIVAGVVTALAALVLWTRISFGRTVHGMAVLGKTEALRDLLAREPLRATEADEAGEQPLHKAAAHGRVELIELLLQHAASPNARCTGGGTPLLMAVFADHLSAVQRLVAAGADVDDCDDTGMTALLVGVASGKPATVRCLLEAGAQTDLKDAAGRTALDVAEQFNQPQIAKLLQARGARHGREVRMKDLRPPKSAGGRHRVPEVLAMPIDSPALLKAKADAQATLGELRALFAQQAKCGVKGPLDASQPHEKMWLGVTELEGSTARGFLMSNPLESNAKPGAQAALALAQVEDWIAELPDGSLRGGHGLKVMMQFARDEYGALPESYTDIASKLPP